MSRIEIKPMTILIIVNVISLLVIFWLMWMIMGSEDASNSAEAENNARDHAALSELSAGDNIDMGENHKQTVSAITKFKTEIEKEVLSTGIAGVDENSTSRLAVQDLSATDAEYLANYRLMKASERNAVTTRDFTAEQAKTVSAQEPGARKVVDYFNKVDVSKNQPINQAVLAKQILDVVRDTETTVNNNDSNYAIASLKDSEKTYIASLQTASAERTNEMRTIQVKRGDTLWKISKRAYGTGFKYQRIFDANPHLKSPNEITTGEFLRVPL
jgi:LysM repeat protein